MGKIDIGQRSIVSVYADSVSCIGRAEQIVENTERRWKDYVEDLRMDSSYQNVVGSDTKAIIFELTNSSEFSTLQVLVKGEEHPPRKFQGLHSFHVDVQ